MLTGKLSYMQLPVLNLENLPQKAGVYFVLVNNDCVYIGKSMNIRHRFKRHHRRDIFNFFPDMQILFLETETLEIERQFIAHFNPVFNDNNLTVKELSKFRKLMHLLMPLSGN